MANAQFDDDRVTSLVGLDSSGVVQKAKVDGVTGRLLVRLAASASPSSQAFTTAKRDDNAVPSAMCVTAGGVLQGVLVDSDRNLFVAM